MPKVSSPSKTTTKRPPIRKAVAPKKISLQDRIVPLEDVDAGGMKILIYGSSGTGKTRLAGTFASEDAPLLHLVCSSNGVNEVRSIKGAAGVDVLEIQEPDDLANIVEALWDEDRYATVVLDHVTEFGNLTLSRIIGMERLPEQASWGMAKQQDYQQMASQVKEYLRGLLSLPHNVILIGQERTYNPREETGSDSIEPYVSMSSSPSVTNWVAPACDYIIRMFKRQRITHEKKVIGGKTKTIERRGKEIDYCALVGPHPTFMTKFRVPPGTELPDVIVDPSYAKIAPLLGV